MTVGSGDPPIASETSERENAQAERAESIQHIDPVGRAGKPSPILPGAATLSQHLQRERHRPRQRAPHARASNDMTSRSDAHADRTICSTCVGQRLNVSSSISLSQTRGRGRIDL